MMHTSPSLTRDAPLWFFASIAVLFVVVSAPATYVVVSAFHGGDHVFGIILSAAMLIALEAGAVGCKLSTLVMDGRYWKIGLNSLTVLLLFLTTAANYAYGADFFLQNPELSPTLMAWRNSDWASVAIAVYAGIVPLLLFVFLSLTVERWKYLHQQQQHPANEYMVIRSVQTVQNGNSNGHTLPNPDTAETKTVPTLSEEHPEERQSILQAIQEIQESGGDISQNKIAMRLYGHTGSRYQRNMIKQVLATVVS
jgi:hypothetical protein